MNLRKEGDNIIMTITDADGKTRERTVHIRSYGEEQPQQPVEREDDPEATRKAFAESGLTYAEVIAMIREKKEKEATPKS